MMYKRRMISANRSTQIMANASAILYVDQGERVNGRWVSNRTQVDKLSVCFQKDPNKKKVHLDDGGERYIGTARIYLTRKAVAHFDHVMVNGQWWKVTDDNTRESREYYKYSLEFLPNES